MNSTKPLITKVRDISALRLSKFLAPTSLIEDALQKISDRNEKKSVQNLLLAKKSIFDK